jgi:exosortase
MRIDDSVFAWASKVSGRHFLAVCLLLLIGVIFRQPLANLVSLSLHDERSSHILVIPLLSAAIIGVRHQRMFQRAAYSPGRGLPLLVSTITLWFCLRTWIASFPFLDALSLTTLLIVLSAISGFILCYGVDSFKAAAFPLLFLAVMIPLPTAVAEHAVVGLQKGSAAASSFLFRVAGIPVIRQGLRFSLPGVDIEIAQECSSIRSSLSLFITGLLAGYVMFQSTGKRVLLSLLTIPIAIFKNACRIVTISWLGIYWNPEFFHGTFHRYSGLPFSLVGLALLGLAIVLINHSFSRSRAGDC